MNELFGSTKMTAYFLWEHSGCDNALNLWYCAEDMACYFEQAGILCESRVEEIKALGIYDDGYVAFIRNVAFRIYIYTQQTDAVANWYMAERLLRVSEWVRALTDMAAIYSTEKAQYSFINEVRSENVRAYYADGQTLN